MKKTLIVNVDHLSEGTMRTVVRELKVIIEDYGWKKAISECINVMEGK